MYIIAKRYYSLSLYLYEIFFILTGKCNYVFINRYLSH